MFAICYIPYLYSIYSYIYSKLIFSDFYILFFVCSYNIEEANLVVDYIEEIQAKIKINGEHLQETDIGIVSPYGEQCKNILTKLNAKGYNEITVGSAETFQGQERKVIVVSTVRTGENLGFVNCGKVCLM